MAKQSVVFRSRNDVLGVRQLPMTLTSDDPADNRTKQEFKQECDINHIMARYRKTGILPDSALAAAARYGDFSQIPNFMEMQEKLIAAHELFDSLPAAVRKQFDNDPGQFISAAETPEGVELMKKLGLGKEEIPASPGQPSSSGGGQPPSPAAQTPPAPAKGASKSKSAPTDGGGSDG